MKMKKIMMSLAIISALLISTSSMADVFCHQNRCHIYCEQGHQYLGSYYPSCWDHRIYHYDTHLRAWQPGYFHHGHRASRWIGGWRGPYGGWHQRHRRYFWAPGYTVQGHLIYRSN